MAAGLGCCSGKESGSKSAQGGIPPDPIGARYPIVSEEETPLPRQWSARDKHQYLGLSQSNLRVHYKGSGKNHKDAASVRADHPIPAACGIYYFEVKVISKGREGYMGIGLSTATVNTNRLPGWEKNSFGYHGDDGNSFCSSGNGQSYGPTFTTGDVVGCCVNLIENSCFYTKNGVNLGIAFRNLPPNLYPTVGLQTPGEVIETNFGQNPFLFDIDDYTQEWRLKTKNCIENFAITNRNGEWQTALHKIVTSYLIHNGYCSTAEAFAKSTGQPIEEELTSIKNRQRIQKLVLTGRIGEAIDTTRELYPGLLESNPNLLFALKCRQFVEMINGTDLAPQTPPGAGFVLPSAPLSPQHIATSQLSVSRLDTTATGAGRNRSKSRSPPAIDAVNGHSSNSTGGSTNNSNGAATEPANEDECMEEDLAVNSRLFEGAGASTNQLENGESNGALNGSAMHNNNHTTHENLGNSVVDLQATRDSGVDDMDTTETVATGDKSPEIPNGNSVVTNGSTNGVSVSIAASSSSSSGRAVVNGSQHYGTSVVPTSTEDAEMETDTNRSRINVSANPSQSSRNCDPSSSSSQASAAAAEATSSSCYNNSSSCEQQQQRITASEATSAVAVNDSAGSSSRTADGVMRLLAFGRELHNMLLQQLSDQSTAATSAAAAAAAAKEHTEANEKILKDAFSLLAYSEPWNSSMSYLLHPVQREPICTALNSAILELQGLSKKPPLELAIAHTRQCVKVMSRANIGYSAFASVADYLQNSTD